MYIQKELHKSFPIYVDGHYPTLPMAQNINYRLTEPFERSGEGGIIAIEKKLDIESHRTSKIVLAVGGSVLLVALIGIGVYCHLRRKK